jgi:hypothetical protein
VLQKLSGVWAKWRKSRRQYAIERALYKAEHGVHDESLEKSVRAGKPPDIFTG